MCYRTLVRWLLTANTLLASRSATAQELGPPPLDTGEVDLTVVPHLAKMAVSVNPADRAEVVSFYQTVYHASDGAAIGWNGNVANCVAGINSLAYKDATVLRINFFRAMAGLPGDVTLDETRNSKCQEAALMMSAEGSLSHSPGTNWHCYTAAGAEAAGKSNLYLGREGPSAIDGYVDDPGSNNTATGHRRWILYPPQKVMGSGSIPASAGWSANALWVIGGTGTRPPQPAFVVWPPTGYVPYQILPRSSGRWSFSYPGANFTAATVSMQRSGTNVALTVEAQSQGYGDNTIVWRPQGVPTGAPADDLTYLVTVGNVVVSSTARTFTYSVTIIDPDLAVLSARGATGNRLTLAWPGTASGYTLQQNPSVADPAGWSAVAGSPQLIGGEYTLTVNVATNRQYYRLRK